MSRPRAKNPRTPNHQSVRQRVLQHMKDVGGEFTMHSFAALGDVHQKSISVALRELCSNEDIHLSSKGKIDGKKAPWRYKVGPRPEGSDLDIKRDPLDKDTANGWRDVAPWMFTPMNLPKGTLRVIKAT